MGIYYRSYLLRYLGVKKSGGDTVLDVGCHDDAFLSDYNATLKVGLDISPVKKYDTEMVAADASHLPFKIKFDRIFAFDVIEHVTDDKSFSLSLVEALSDNGTLIITTPSKSFRIFPDFLTSWLIKKWGHKKIGYSLEEFEGWFSKTDYKIEKSIYWNAYFFRYFYFPLIFFWRFIPILAKGILPIVAKLDSKFLRGVNGFLLVEIKKVQR